MTENHFFDALTNVLEGPDLECRYLCEFIYNFTKWELQLSFIKELKLRFSMSVCPIYYVHIIWVVLSEFVCFDGKRKKNHIFGLLGDYLRLGHLKNDILSHNDDAYNLVLRLWSTAFAFWPFLSLCWKFLKLNLISIASLAYAYMLCISLSWKKKKNDLIFSPKYSNLCF